MRYKKSQVKFNIWQHTRGGSKKRAPSALFFYLNTTGVGGGRTCSVTRTNSWGMMMGGVTTNLSVTEASAQAVLVTKNRVDAIRLYKLFIWVVLTEIFYLNYRARQNLPRSWAANCSLLSPVGYITVLPKTSIQLFMCGCNKNCAPAHFFLKYQLF